MTLRSRLWLALLLIPSLISTENVLAQDVNVLEGCREQSLDLDQIHTCLDGYLDTMDGNIKSLTDFLSQSLSGEALSGLDRSQQAFVEFRRQNCLWYLEFSSPRNDAEQIAKNCLATMSNQRLRELQGLITADDETDKTISGYYVYGAAANTFQLCGSIDRYWVEGSRDNMAQLQETYLSEVTDGLQLMHATLVGRLNSDAEAPEGHIGVFEMKNFIDVRQPTNSDCVAPSRLATLGIEASDVDTTDQTREVFDDEQLEGEEPEQQLTAYFGAWLADCVEISNRKSCSLVVELRNSSADNSVDEGALGPRLIINRTPSQGTFAEVHFPGREIDSPTLIRWAVDSQQFGDIVSSEIRVDQIGARQLISESSFLMEQLLPALIDGHETIITVLEDIDDEAGADFQGTLKGLTKALIFADDFVRDDV